MAKAAILNDIPKGKFRVIYVDLFSHEDGVVKDCDTPGEAVAIADGQNRQRKGEMDTVYYAYNDERTLIRDHTAVDGPDIAP